MRPRPLFFNPCSSLQPYPSKESYSLIVKLFAGQVINFYQEKLLPAQTFLTENDKNYIHLKIHDWLSKDAKDKGKMLSSAPIYFKNINSVIGNILKIPCGIEDTLIKALEAKIKLKTKIDLLNIPTEDKIVHKARIDNIIEKSMLRFLAKIFLAQMIQRFATQLLENQKEITDKDIFDMFKFISRWLSNKESKLSGDKATSDGLFNKVENILLVHLGVPKGFGNAFIQELKTKEAEIIAQQSKSENPCVLTFTSMEEQRPRWGCSGF